jgi:hypothetical protein
VLVAETSVIFFALNFMNVQRSVSETHRAQRKDGTTDGKHRAIILGESRPANYCF